MDYYKALDRLDTLSLAKVEQLLRAAEDQITAYERAIKNYPPARLEKYGKPYMNGLVNDRNRIKGRLDYLRSTEKSAR